MSAERVGTSEDGRSVDVWAPFVWSALALAIAFGFGLGATLFAAPLLGWPLGRWWQAAAQVHAHEFLFGWAGLMVLGVGFHFLPRLRGRTLAHPDRSGPVLWLLMSGLVLRAVSQPLVDLASRLELDSWARIALLISAILELLGATLALTMLTQTLRGAPALSSRPRLVEIMPFLAVSFASLWLALAMNLAAVVLAPGDGVLAGGAYRVSLLIALYGFLVPVSIGVGARLFPLHFAAPMAAPRVLHVGLALLLIGLALRVTGELLVAPTLTATGLLAIASGSAFCIVGSRVFAARRAVAGGREPWYTDAAQWHGLIAFGCLALNALLLAMAAMATIAPDLLEVSARAEWHIMGLGFVTLLIFGEATKLLPGFAGRPLRAAALVWVTLCLLALAIILRIGPILVPDLFQGSVRSIGLVGSGVAGVLAIVALGLNLSRSETT